MTYLLFTNNNKNIPQYFKASSNCNDIVNSYFDLNDKTKFIVHGWLTHYKVNGWMDVSKVFLFVSNSNITFIYEMHLFHKNMKNYILNQSNYNVIVYDWSTYSVNIDYIEAAADTKPVGDLLAAFINLLITCKNVTTDSFQLIGHSLGAHVSGYAGSHFTDPKLGRISGLDPAGPGFMVNDPNTRLDPTDAKLVVVSHTNRGDMDFT